MRLALFDYSAISLESLRGNVIRKHELRRREPLLAYRLGELDFSSLGLLDVIKTGVAVQQNPVGRCSGMA